MPPSSRSPRSSQPYTGDFTGSAERSRSHLLGEEAASESEVGVVIAPYRICPVGAHVDHQGGTSLGMAIDACTALAFVPSDRIEITSANFSGRVVIDPESPGEVAIPEWGRYALAAFLSVRPRIEGVARGFIGRVEGSLPGGGLSSSASVVLAYLMALGEVNGIELSPQEWVEHSRIAENDYVGVRSGILDPASIAGGRKDHLLFIDAQASTWEPISLGAGAPGYRFLVASTGTERNLANTDFNLRVQECQEAARSIAERIGLPGVSRLADLPRAALRDNLESLEPPNRERARHFIGECDRVAEARRHYQDADLVAFGRVMSQSCQSSIENYETGSPELVQLQRIWQSTEGVLGARFSGAGFGGCSVALVRAEDAAAVKRSVLERLVRAVPELSGRAHIFEVSSASGLRVVR